MKNQLLYKLTSGKNSKFAYYLRGYLRQLVPHWISCIQGRRLLSSIARRTDKQYIEQRIQYYCKLQNKSLLPSTAPQIKDWHIPKKQKVYYFDSQEVTRAFPKNLRWQILPGDIVHVPQIPSIVKSRPLCKGNENSVLLKMDKVRHFIFVKDNLPFEQKKPIAIFRGKVVGKKERMQFMEMYFGSTICNCGDVSRSKDIPTAWQTPKLTINDHLQYRYIMALEGNDVASNLKWVMSSNSIAIMPRPTCETWFMEGTLTPNYHYIEIKPDFSDLEEKITYYNNHLDEARAIIQHAHEYVEPFKDKHREQLILLGVMDKYLHLTNADYQSQI